MLIKRGLTGKRLTIPFLAFFLRWISTVTAGGIAECQTEKPIISGGLVECTPLLIVYGRQST